MEINEMNLEQIEARASEIKAELADATEERMQELSAEIEQLSAHKEQLQLLETREAQVEEIEAGAPVKVIETMKQEERKMFDASTVEYRNAFYANLFGNATTEQRAILADNSTYGDGVSIPTTLDTAIWDQVTTAHPILQDVTTIRSGMVLKVTQATPAAISKKKDSDASSEQTFTMVDVNLVGADYHTYVELSYAEAKMSQGAMEQFLASEIANAIGEALAKDIFARILTDAAAQSVTSTGDYFADIAKALGKATLAANAVIYANPADYYAIMGAVDTNGQPIIRDGVALGATIKKDSAATKITVVDPAQFVLNVVQDTMVEAERDAKNAQFVIGGYCRAEGCLRKIKAAAFIA